MLPVRDIAHAIVAGILGLELLDSLGGENARSGAMLDHITGLASLIPTVPAPTPAQVRDAVGSETPIVSVPGWALPPLTSAIGIALRDRILTSDEYNAMADGLADSDAPTNGQTMFADWLKESADSLGRHYVNDTLRHFTAADATRIVET